MPLIDVLEKLAGYIPERITGVGHKTCRVFAFDGWKYLDLEDPAQSGPWLEHALREEIEARGWRWWVYRSMLPGGYGATVYRTGHEDDVTAESPAEALAAALLAALGAGAGAGQHE